MEVELFSNVLSEEDTVEVDADYDNLGDEGERCGICMDIVIDRGVLDCCQHWFCFVCIDNWATITNLCPLCQNEFQLITCVPVYDTIGSSKIDEDSDFRDDDWSVEGKNNNLSFPSYYIDENAVTCLDGDRCKIRSGSVTYEETLALDTSIACDSCDIWYHAFCVGFDPEGTGVESWLCPRCLGNEADQISDLKELYYPAKNDDQHRLVDTSSGKVSICVADSGETAMVVSRIDGEDVVDERIMTSLSNQELIDHCKVEQSVSGSDFCSSEMKKPPDEGPKSKVPSVKFGKTVIKCEPDDGESRLPSNVGLSFASTLPDDNTNHSLGGDECVHDASIDENLEDVKADIAQKPGAKRKRLGKSFRKNSDKGPHEGRSVGVSSTKKVKAERRTRNTLIGQADVCEDSNINSKMRESSADDLGRNVTAKNQPIDIMSIVQGTKTGTAKRQKEAGKCKIEKNAAGLRVKKIMRRPSEEKESDSVVEKLRKEIREAVRNKPSSDIGKCILDPNLLSAFRAAVAGSVAEPTKKAPSAIVKAKKLMLQKGKARENLTKKIYATSNGKRRRAWDRDCEIEFWKHRCLTTAKPEKVETLRSVLNLLKRGQGIKIVEQNTEEAKAPILSRLYLADTSLFPRKDDIQPLSVLKAAACSNKKSGEKHIETCTDDSASKPLDLNEDVARSNTGSADDKKSLCSSSKNESASGKFPSRGHPDKASPQKKMNGNTGDVKIDKRKWALEVLARKSASDATGSMHQNQENTAFKGNYPLLAELPTDMRPKLAPTRQNKISLSVRQAQLYRLTEHFLKMTNLSAMRRTAETELAVADAINIEKQVADRSNSKVVYLNLCSQEIRNRATSNGTSTLAVSIPSSPTPVPTMGDSEFQPSSTVQVLSKGDISSSQSLNSEAEAALRAAGLFSDSPPSSPLNKVDYLNGDGNPSGEAKKEELESIFEMDCHPDLDIYGDFEYDLDEEDYIGAAAINSSKIQPEEGESKVKVVFSSLSSVKPDNASAANEKDLPKTDILLSTPSLLECSTEVGSEISPVEDKVDPVPLPGNTSLESEVEELSVAECEALYGPDNEPTNKSCSNTVQAGDIALQSANDLDIHNSDKNTVTTDSLHCNVVGERSSSALDHKGKVDEQKNSNRKVDKKSEHAETVLKKVEAYVKEHIRPLCKSGVITVDQYRWAVGRTTEKVMKYHTKSKNANFLIKEGEKVKKLAEQYVDSAKQKEIK